jgi:hypothetical protein
MGSQQPLSVIEEDERQGGNDEYFKPAFLRQRRRSSGGDTFLSTGTIEERDIDERGSVAAASLRSASSGEDRVSVAIIKSSSRDSTHPTVNIGRIIHQQVDSGSDDEREGSLVSVNLSEEISCSHHVASPTSQTLEGAWEEEDIGQLEQRSHYFDPTALVNSSAVSGSRVINRRRAVVPALDLESLRRNLFPDEDDGDDHENDRGIESVAPGEVDGDSGTNAVIQESTIHRDTNSGSSTSTGGVTYRASQPVDLGSSAHLYGASDLTSAVVEEVEVEAEEASAMSVGIQTDKAEAGGTVLAALASSAAHEGAIISEKPKGRVEFLMEDDRDQSQCRGDGRQTDVQGEGGGEGEGRDDGKSDETFEEDNYDTLSSPFTRADCGCGSACSWCDFDQCCPCLKWYHKTSIARFSRNLFLLTWRAFVPLYRNKTALIIRTLTALLYAVILALIYQHTGYDQKSIQGRIGILFFITVNQVSTVSAITLQ